MYALYIEDLQARFVWRCSCCCFPFVCVGVL